MPVIRMKAADAPIPLAVEAAGRISPWMIVQNAFRLWRLVAGMVLAGAVAGWLFHQNQPPVYEVVLELAVDIDYVQTGNLTEFEEDMVLNTIGELLVSEPVVNQVVERVTAEGLAADYQSLKRMALLERKMKVWNLRVQHTDRHLVERVASLWGEVGQAALMDAYLHALQAERLMRDIHRLENCLENAAVVVPVQPVCAGLPFEEVQQRVIETGQVLTTERVASRGLLAGLRLGKLEAPVSTAILVRFGLGPLILVSALIGLLLGVAVSQWNLLARKTEPRGDTA